MILCSQAVVVIHGKLRVEERDVAGGSQRTLFVCVQGRRFRDWVVVECLEVCEASTKTMGG